MVDGYYLLTNYTGALRQSFRLGYNKPSYPSSLRLYPSLAPLPAQPPIYLFLPHPSVSYFQAGELLIGRAPAYLLSHHVR